MDPKIALLGGGERERERERERDCVFGGGGGMRGYMRKREKILLETSSFQIWQKI